MNRLALLIAAALIAPAAGVDAAFINFDEYAAMNANGALTTRYAALGVTFDSRNSGTWVGLAGGDPGSWGVDGTNGTQFLGNNGSNNNHTYSQSVFFATAQGAVSFDASRTKGSTAGQSLTAIAYNSANAAVATEVLILGDVNTWSSFSLSGSGIVRLDMIGSTLASFNPYAIDNLRFVTASAAVPEPASALMLGLGAAGVGLVGWKRSRRSAA